ncbi:MAG TPA: HDIG domain-containing protein [Patescibacteria group bacterium]|nr:HDIG domain-containing protein [Patescibacteria group bacterium]
MRSIHQLLQDFLDRSANDYTQSLAYRLVLGTVFFILCMLILSADFFPEKIALQVGQVSDSDVIAPRTVSYVDLAKTKKLEMEVLASVANVYDLDVAAMTKAEESMGQIFKAAQLVAADKNTLSTEQKQERLQAELSVSLPQSVVNELAVMDAPTLAKTEEYTRTLLRKYLQRGIRDDDLDIARRQVVIETEELELSKTVETVIAGVAQTLLRPTFILNVRETDKRKQAALANIEPVRETVKKGYVLVRRGDVVTVEQIQVMQEMGLYAGRFNELRVLGLGVFVLTMSGIFLCYLKRFSPHVFQNDAKLLLLTLILLLTVMLGKAAYYYSAFAAPVAAGALLTAILVNTRAGIMMAVVLVAFFGVIVENDMRAIVTILAGSLTGIYSVSKMTHGYSLTRTGIMIAVVHFLVIGSLGLIEQLPHMQLFQQIVIGLVNGITVAVITTGLLPYLEHAFNITTTIKLLNFARPNHPLLQRLMMDAPGTYHHSVLVGNLAETAAGSIGADPIIVRVGAYYHDIGKIKRPYFFIENQVGAENPHDKIAPSLSTLIVTSHIRDGEELCREYQIPAVIVDIVRQHHGTMLVSYFYNRAAETERSECIIEADFRYEGPCPQSKEAALVMLADACEAAVRSINKPNVNRIEAMVRRVIKERLHDGQLDECNLTLRDLKIIGDVYIRLLSGMFHNRIEYPEALKELERKKGKNGNNYKQLPAREDSGSCSGNNSENGTCKNS